MIISDVTVTIIDDPLGSKIRALASLTLNGCLRLNDMRVIEGTGGLFIAYPNDSFEHPTRYKSIYMPLDSILADDIQTAILGKYRKMKGEGK